MTPQPQVFISYQRTDGDFARRVRDHLVATGVRTWMDEFDIPVGAYWPDEIDKGLTSSDIIVGVLSPDAVDSRNVKNEWDWAIQNDKRLLLLQVTPTVIPHRYVSINFIDATYDVTGALGSLLNTLGITEIAPELELPETRYARSGDINIAYQVTGSGPLDLVMVPGFISNLDAQWDWPEDVLVFRRLSAVIRLIRFDKRGTGLSDRVSNQTLPSLEQRMDDVRAVMDAAQSERAVLLGSSEGGPMSLLFAATYPERTIALILVSSMVKGKWSPDYPWAPTEEILAEYFTALEDNWGTGRPISGPLPGGRPVGHEQRWTRYQRAAASPGAAAALERMNAEIDVRDVLSSIRVPTLIVHHTDDTIVRVEEGRYLAEHIAGARYIELPGNGHGTFVLADLIAADIEPFISALPRGAEVQDVDTVLATMLAVEVTVNGPAGDQNRLPPLTGPALTRFRGRQITISDDHLVASFDGPARAIHCAVAILDVLRAHGMDARAGLHTGEVDLVGNTVSGVPARIATELAALAGTNEVIVTSTVKDLVAGSHLRFAERQSRQLADLPDAWRLYVVDQTGVD